MTGSRARTALAAASLIALGAAAGIAVDRLLHRRPHVQVIGLRDVSENPLGMIERVVPLRPDQRTRIAAILATRQDQIDAVWSDTHTRLLGALDSLVDDIVAVLDADQAVRFRAHVRELHAEPGPPRIPAGR